MEMDIRALWPDARVLCYRHIADSNLHVVVNVPSAGNEQPHHEVDEMVHGVVRAVDGTVSAKHGIGLVRKPFLAFTRMPEELALMRVLKASQEPHRLQNLGKVLDGLWKAGSM